VDFTAYDICEGYSTFDKISNTFTFTPKSLLIPSLEYCVNLQVDSLEDKDNVDFKWTFTTEPNLSSIRLFVQTTTQEKVSHHLITSDVNHIICYFFLC
jgi:hypothetical protein